MTLLVALAARSVISDSFNSRRHPDTGSVSPSRSCGAKLIINRPSSQQQKNNQKTTFRLRTAVNTTSHYPMTITMDHNNKMIENNSLRRYSHNNNNNNNSHKSRMGSFISHLTFAVVFHVVCTAWMPSLYPCTSYEDESYTQPWYATSLSQLPQEQGRRRMLLTTDVAKTITTTTTTTPTNLRHSNNSSIQRIHQPSSSNKLVLETPPSLQSIVAGMGRVRRDDFARTFDTGVPLLPSSQGNDDVLLLYSHPTSLPRSFNMSQMTSSRSIPLLSSPEDATHNCMTMKLILIEPAEPQTCVAIMGNWQSHHVHKWMRVNPSTPGKPATLEQPLHLTSRRKTRANYRIQLPSAQQSREAFSFFTNYASRLDETLDKLRPIAKTVAQGKMNNTIVVMVCNHGQSEMFINFVCSARSRGLDISQVLLFATDEETRDLGESLGIATFYDEKMFGALPKTAANHYFDGTFAKMVLAKVYSAHLISMLQYNVLLQDVDVVWYRNPLEYFSSPSIGDFDMYFQDNGSRSFVYEAFQANTGFYFARYNDRTAYYFSSMIRHADLILQSGDDQNAMNTVLNDQASFTGLSIKVLNRNLNNFPGGYHYHSSHRQMKDMIQGKTLPYMFHMSWTKHKLEKRQFLEQMGDFHVSDQCVGKTAMEIAQSMGGSRDVAASCCLAEPAIKCHYRDKPSKIPCQDSPAYETGQPSFW